MSSMLNSNNSFGECIKGNNTSSVLVLAALTAFGILMAASLLILPISLLFILAAVALLLLLLKPEYAVFTLFILILPAPCLQIIMGDIKITVDQFAVVIALLSWMIAVSIKKIGPYQKTECDVPLLLFAGWAFLSLLWSHDRTNGTENLIRLFISLSAFFVVAGIVRTQRPLQIIFGIVILMGIIDASLAISFPYTDFYINRYWDINEFMGLKLSFWPLNQTIPRGRASGFSSPHNTAALMAIPITFAMMFFIVTKNVTKRRWLLAFVILMYTGCLATLSKGPVISLLIGTVFVVLHLKPLRQRLFTIMISLFIATIALFCLARANGLARAIQGVGTDLQVRADNPERETSVGNRIVSWSIGLEKLYETAGIGTGIGGFDQYLPTKWIDGAHPVTLFDFGLIGFALYLWILARAYRFFMNALKNCHNEYFQRLLIVYMGGYLTILISWIVSCSYVHIHIWFYLAIGVVIARLAASAHPDYGRELPFPQKGGGSIVTI